MEFQIREIKNIVIYDIKGDLRLSEDMPVMLHDHVKAHLDIGKRNFLLNFEDVQYMDSFGVGQLVGCLTSISKVGGKLKITNLVPRIRYIFEVTGMIKVFKVTDDEETAIKNYSD
jgi:anti-anti-sigma factor